MAKSEKKKRPRPQASTREEVLTVASKPAGFADDLFLAKQAVSARLLRAGLRGNVMALGTSRTVAAAVARASRNVHAVGIGRKIVDGKTTAERAVRIHLLQKLAPSLLPPKDRLPATVDGFPTDIIESAPAFIAAKSAPQTCTTRRKRRQVPRVAGISTAHRDVTAGTIAYFCRSTAHGDRPGDFFVLSNNHVFANVNLGHRGDDLYQPGPADGGTTADHFAELHRFVPIRLGGTVANKVDAAIGRLLPGTTFQRRICSIGTITGTMVPREQAAVRKHGRTTGYTEGIITDVAYDALIGMDHADPSVVALFDNQIRIEVSPPFAAFGLGGDSGSLVVARNTLQAVGLYFAGPPSGDYGVANSIADVLTELQIELL
jgi:hypothetical protein